MKLADICEINPKTEVLDDNTLVSFVAMPDVSEDGRINVGTYRTCGEVKKGFTNFKEGDVLFAKITPCMENGKGALATGLKNGLGFGSTEFHVLRPNAMIVLGQWLYYLTSWSAFRKNAEMHMTGSAGQKRVPKSFLEKYEVEVPPIDDQKHQILQLNLIRKIIDARQQQLSALDDLIKARFVEMFGDPIGNEKRWPTDSLTHACSKIFGGGTPSKSHPEYFEGSIPWVSPKDMKSDVIIDSIDHITEDAIEHSTTNLVPEGSVLMVVRSGILKHDLPVAINAVPVTINQDMKAFVPGESITASFLRNYFKAIEPDALAGVRGVTADNIDFKAFQQREIIIPPINIQNEFEELCKQIDKSKSVIQKSLDETQLLFDSLMQKYFG